MLRGILFTLPELIDEVYRLNKGNLFSEIDVYKKAALILSSEITVENLEAEGYFNLIEEYLKSIEKTIELNNKIRAFEN